MDRKSGKEAQTMGERCFTDGLGSHHIRPKKRRRYNSRKFLQVLVTTAHVLSKEVSWGFNAAGPIAVLHKACQSNKAGQCHNVKSCGILRPVTTTTALNLFFRRRRRRDNNRGNYNRFIHRQRRHHEDHAEATHDSPDGAENKEQEVQLVISDKPQKTIGMGQRIVVDAVTGLLERASLHSTGLVVEAGIDNTLARIVRGRMGLVRIAFHRLTFPQIRISGGGTLTIAHGASLDPMSLAAPGFLRKFLNLKRLRKNFEMEVTSVTFTQEDVTESVWIHRGLQLLLNRIYRSILVRTLGGLMREAKVMLDTIEITDSGKLSCRGRTAPGSIPFEVLTGVMVSPCGRVVRFPGMEMRLLSAAIGIPLQDVDLDIGANARLKSLRIDGQSKRLELSLWTNITPLHVDRDRFQNVVRTPTNDVKYARYYCDLGKWITKIGKFGQ